MTNAIPFGDEPSRRSFTHDLCLTPLLSFSLEPDIFLLFSDILSKMGQTRSQGRSKEN